MTVAIKVGCIQGDKDERGDPDEDRPERDEEVGQGSVDDGRVASYILKDIEPVSLDDNGKDHVQDRKAQSNKKIDRERTAFLSNRLVRRRLSDHEIHPPLKGQRGSRDPDNCSDGNPGGNITPDGCPIHDIRIPHDRIHEPDERGKAAPEDEQARANAPARGFGEVPSERDRGRGKGEEREDGEHVVNGRHFRVLKQTTREKRRVVSAERTIRLVCSG